MSGDFPTLSEVGEENIRGYLKRRRMKTVYMTTPDSFCPYCKETEEPLEFHCLVKKCEHPETVCEFVKGGGVRGRFPKPHSQMERDRLGKNWLIYIRCNIKNYEHEIEGFINWIMPYVECGSGANDFLGYTIYEDDEIPKLYYKGDTANV